MKKHHRQARKRWVADLGLSDQSSYEQVAREVQKSLGAAVIADFQHTKENCAQFLYLVSLKNYGKSTHEHCAKQQDQDSGGESGRVGSPHLRLGEGAEACGTCCTPDSYSTGKE